MCSGCCRGSPWLRSPAGLRRGSNGQSSVHVVQISTSRSWSGVCLPGESSGFTWRNYSGRRISPSFIRAGRSMRGHGDSTCGQPARSRLPAASLLWRAVSRATRGLSVFCGTLVTVLGFVNVYPFRFSYVADHFQFLASLGVIVPVASALTVASTRQTGPEADRHGPRGGSSHRARRHAMASQRRLSRGGDVVSRHNRA